MSDFSGDLIGQRRWVACHALKYGWHTTSDSSADGSSQPRTGPQLKTYIEKVTKEEMRKAAALGVQAVFSDELAHNHGRFWKSSAKSLRGTLKRRIWNLIVAVSLGLGTPLFAQETTDPAVLFQQLQVRETTDKARETLFTRGTLDPHTRSYLCTNLPPMIEKGPKGASHQSHQWRNAALLAGQLKILEAAPALAKWIGLDYFGDDVNLARVERLETNPAAKALSLIGDPAIPALKSVLEHDSPHERFYAYLVLNQIDTFAARAVIHARLDREDDPHLRDFIQKTPM